MNNGSNATDRKSINHSNLQASMYCASAPGKVILFGEHSVVYGQPAVAAALSDLRIHVCVETIPHNNDPAKNRIFILMPDLPKPVEIGVPMDNFIAILSQLKCPPTMECTRELETLIKTTAPRDIDVIIDEHTIHAILPVLYLISQILPTTILVEFGCIVKVRSKDLPVGAGLGSSAAFGVACSAALLQWRYHHPYRCNESEDASCQIHFPVTASSAPPKALLDEINEYAYYSEMLLHGRPSGIDNTVSSYGGALSFTRSHHEVSFDPIPLPNEQGRNPFHLILVNTHVPRQTKQLVAAVRNLHDHHPGIFTPILEAMGQISATFCTTMKRNAEETLRSNNPHHDDDIVLTLVRTNQALLTSLGVSHPSLERICNAINNNTEYRTYSAAKLTGGGGGGCAMILLRPPVSSCNNDATVEKLRIKLVNELQTAGQPDYQYTFLSSTVGGEGVLFVPQTDFEQAH
jgi:mevalonate kinase